MILAFKGAPWGADGRQVGTGTGGILSARRVEPVVCDSLPGGRGNQNSSGARFAQDMPESVLVTGRNRLYHGGQCLLPKRDEAAGGSASSTNSPQERPRPPGSYCSGGMPGGKGVQGERGTAGGGGIPCAVLSTDRVQSFDPDY
jgi:hypothetical protein